MLFLRKLRQHLTLGLTTNILQLLLKKDLTKFLYPSGGPGRELKNRLANREVLLGAMIPLSEALQNTGTTEIISQQILHVVGGLPAWSILAIIMAVTMCLSDIINNAATALIMAPISVSIAIELGLSIDPFLMAVAIGASCDFLSQIGHQCNALILCTGVYKFGDYWRLGLPLEIIIVAVSIPVLLLVWF